MIEKYLNKRNSLRELSDEEFEEILPTLAEELEDVSYSYVYSVEELVNDWHNLCRINVVDGHTSSTVRTGMKICEHFFPNFFKIQNNKGTNFKSLWKREVLEKVLRWNRKSHSTPYLSELRRGIYFCEGLTKNTMFRPHIAKMISEFYSSKIVLDPCCGWGGRMIGTVASGAEYIGFETNTETYDNLNRIAKFFAIEDKVTLINDGSERMDQYDFPHADITLTSPPYFNLEVYSESDKQSENMFQTYEEWKEKWLKVVISKSLERTNVSCWNVHNVGKMKMIEDVEQIHNDLGYELTKEFSLVSSKRQTNQNKTGNKKNQDMTRCFRTMVP